MPFWEDYTCYKKEETVEYRIKKCSESDRLKSTV